MTNLSSLSKGIRLSRILMVLGLIGTGFAVWQFGPVGMFTSLVALAAFLQGQYLQSARKNLQRLEDVLRRAGTGDMESRVVQLPDAGEIQELGWLINRQLDLSDAFVREARASLHYVARGRFFRQVIRRGLPGAFGHGAEDINAATAAMRDKFSGFRALTDEFEQRLQQVSQIVQQSSVHLRDTAGSMRDSVIRSQGEAENVVESSGQTSANVSTVAASTTQLSAAVQEIGEQSVLSARTNSEAVARARDTVHAMEELQKSVGEITGILELIQSIASQTNLLALNATIESARAGEAGRGFAVVAAEVKSLANQTTEATETISARVDAIRARTQDAVSGIEALEASMESLNEISNAIAAAVEEQDAATREISRNMENAAEGTRVVSSTMTGIAYNIEKTGDSAEELLNASDELKSQADTLEQEVEAYLAKARAVA